MADSSKDKIEDLESVSVEIPECEGLSRRLWNTKCVTLYTKEGKLVGEGMCHSVKLDLVVGTNDPLGDSHVAIHICQSHSKDDILQDLVYALMAWPTKLVHYHSASLHDHEAKDNWNRLQATCANPPLSTRPYTSVIRNPPREGPLKFKELLSEESINLVSSRVCCLKNYVQPFPREKIKSFRKRMYNQSTFKFRAHMKTEVHMSVNRDVRGRRIVTMEGNSVCMRAWMHIFGVLQATFY